MHEGVAILGTVAHVAQDTSLFVYLSFTDTCLFGFVSGRVSFGFFLSRGRVQRRYQEMVSRCGSDGGVGSVSSLTEDVSDVLPLRRGDDEKLTLFDDDVRRRAAEDNVALPEKFDTKGDLRSFMKELLAT